MSKYLLGIDIGTSGAKALVIDTAGDVIASATEEYPLYTPSRCGASRTRRTGGREQ